MAASAKDLLGVPIIQAIINELISFASEEIKLFLGANDELKKLRRTLISIQAVLSLSSVLTRNLASVTSIRIWHCSELMFLPQVLLQGNNVLQSLEVYDCPKLGSIFPSQEKEVVSNNSLTRFEISLCPALKYVPNLQGLNSLRELDISFCEGLKSLSDGIQDLKGLEELSIGGYSEKLESFPFPSIKRRISSPEEGIIHQCFVSLRSLTIWGWYGLESLPYQLQYLTSLQYLSVSQFPSLVVLPEWLGHLASLQYLRICDCNNLKYLPSKEQMLRLTLLQRLNLDDCRLLEKRCRSGGDEWHKIAHIPYLVLN